jgi:hypothetical protein
MITYVVANEQLWLSIMERRLDKALQDQNTFST